MTVSTDPQCVQTLARRAKAVSPGTSLETVCELLRVSPYPMVAVVDASGESSVLLTGRLIGFVSARSISERLFALPTPERDAFRKQGLAKDVCVPLFEGICATPADSVETVCARFDRAGLDALPVIEADETPYYLGMVSRSDLFRDLRRPFVPAQIGGMATPFGVYLTDGTTSGGVGTLALAATGLFTLTLHLSGFAVLAGVAYLWTHHAPFVHWEQMNRVPTLPAPLAHIVRETVPAIAQTALFLTVLRQTPLAGYHAAEHMTVHAVERGEPLLPDVVRTMPRVHPRCSTNIVAGLMLFYLIGTAFADILTGGLSYLLGALAAALWWRSFGAWLQTHATTCPPTDAQIASGIRAARALLDARDLPLHGATRPLPAWRIRINRIWQAGFVQIFMGSAVGIGLLWLLAQAFPVVLSVFE